MNKVEQAINYIVENNKPAKINGTVIDTFTAKMVHTVATRLDEENKVKLYSLPINKMVAVAYKVLTY